MGGFDYIPKVGKIYVVTLTLADTWYEILTASQTRGIRGFKIKARQEFNSSGLQTSGLRPFKLALKDSPDTGDSAGNGYISNTGAGSGDTFGPVNGLWASSDVAGCVLEIQIYE